MEKLEIKNLEVLCGEKKLLKKINISINVGETVLLLGPNGAGKTVLGKVIMGHPAYKIKKGKIMLNEKSINKLETEERAKKGIFLSFQEPEQIKEISLSKFLRKIVRKKKEISIFEFKDRLKEMEANLELKDDFSEESLNVTFSGGEKKKSEILQMISLSPKFIILDEIDSGLDIDSLKIVFENIKKFIKKEDKGLLIISHNESLLKYIKPDRFYVLKEGRIVLKSSSEKLLKEVYKKGFSWIERPN